MNVCTLASARLFSILSSLAPTIGRSSHLDVPKVPASPQACAEALLGESSLVLVIPATSRQLALHPCLVSMAPLPGLDL